MNSEHNGLGPVYRMQWNSLADMDSVLTGNNKGLKPRLNWFGLSANALGEHWSGKKTWESDMLIYADFLSREDLYASDNKRYLLNGFRLGMLDGHDLLHGSELLDLLLLYGGVYQNLFLWENKVFARRRMTNPAFLAELNIDFHFRIPLGTKHQLLIGSRGGYAYDISSRKWKRKADMMPVLPKTQVGGISLSFFVEYTAI